MVKTAILKAKGFTAELPRDFIRVVSVKRYEKDLKCLYFRDATACILTGNNELYYVIGSCIYFSGSFSRWWAIRIIQRVYYWLFPKKYELEYTCKSQ